MIERFDNIFNFEDEFFEIPEKMIEDMRLIQLNNAMPIKYKIIFNFGGFN